MGHAADDFWSCDAEVLRTVDGVSETAFGTNADTVVMKGRLPDLVAFAMNLSRHERAMISIVRPGSAFIGADEIEKLTARPDYPGPTPR